VSATTCRALAAIGLPTSRDPLLISALSARLAP
jgi:hypothetical protein